MSVLISSVFRTDDIVLNEEFTISEDSSDLVESTTIIFEKSLFSSKREEPDSSNGKYDNVFLAFY